MRPAVNVAPRAGHDERSEVAHALQRGATLVEYALLVSLVALVAAAAVQAFSDDAANDFQDRSDRVGNPTNLTPTS